MIKVAFLILSHNQIDLVYKKIDLLDAENHHFYIHLDRKYITPINKHYLDKLNVFFINKRYNISWGGFNIVKASLELINEAKSHSCNYDYYVLLSGQCFPIKSNLFIDRFLELNNNKSFIEYEKFSFNSGYSVNLDRFYYPVFFDQIRFLRKNEIRIGRKKYEYKKYLFKAIKRVYKILSIRRKVPFQNLCFGSQWWVLHRVAISSILSYINNNSKICKYFQYTWSPDELFFHTILYNSSLPERIINRSLWYIDWNTNGPPKTLINEDFNTLKISNALFARKFDQENSRHLIENVTKYLMNIDNCL